MEFSLVFRPLIILVGRPLQRREIQSTERSGPPLLLFELDTGLLRCNRLALALNDVLLATRWIFHVADGPLSLTQLQGRPPSVGISLRRENLRLLHR